MTEKTHRYFEYGDAEAITLLSTGVPRFTLHTFETRANFDGNPVLLEGGLKHVIGTLFELEWEDITYLESKKKYFKKKMIKLNDGWAWTLLPRYEGGTVSQKWIQKGKLWMWNGIREKKLLSDN